MVAERGTELLAPDRFTKPLSIIIQPLALTPNLFTVSPLNGKLKPIGNPAPNTAVPPNGVRGETKYSSLLVVLPNTVPPVIAT